jgi:hypothetical protein
MQVVAPTMHFHIGYVGLVPVAAEIEKLSTNRTNQLVEISKCDWNTAETSWDFECNPLVESSESARPNLPR